MTNENNQKDRLYINFGPETIVETDENGDSVITTLGPGEEYVDGQKLVSSFVKFFTVEEATNDK